jgi:hypothetical protein
MEDPLPGFSRATILIDKEWADNLVSHAGIELQSDGEYIRRIHSN